MNLSVEGTIWTVYGPLRIVLTDGNHAHVSTNAKVQEFVIRGVRITGSAHFWRHPDGEWRPYQPGEDEWRGYNNVTVSRRDTWKNASDAARRTLLEVSKAALLDFLKDHPTALEDAAEKDRQHRLEGLRRQLAETEAKAAELRVQITALGGEVTTFTLSDQQVRDLLSRALVAGRTYGPEAKTWLTDQASIDDLMRGLRGQS